MVNDEQHYVQYDMDPAHVILESENIDGLTLNGMGTKSVSAWAYDFGKGRVVFTAVGPHHARDVESAISGGAEAFGALAAEGPLVMDLRRLFEQGLAAHQAGRVAEAEGVYRQVLRTDAEYFPALHMLGFPESPAGQV